MRQALLAVLLVAGGLAGCIGENVTVENETIHTETHCQTEARSGTIGPDEQLSVQETANGTPAEALVEYEPETHVGTVDLSLANEDEEVWNTQLTGLGNSVETTVPDLPRGNYTLTATTDDGYAQATLTLGLGWGDGGCE